MKDMRYHIRRLVVSYDLPTEKLFPRMYHNIDGQHSSFCHIHCITMYPFLWVNHLINLQPPLLGPVRGFANKLTDPTNIIYSLR